MAPTPLLNTGNPRSDSPSRRFEFQQRSGRRRQRRFEGHHRGPQRDGNLCIELSSRRRKREERAHASGYEPKGFAVLGRSFIETDNVGLTVRETEDPSDLLTACDTVDVDDAEVNRAPGVDKRPSFTKVARANYPSEPPAEHVPPKRDRAITNDKRSRLMGYGRL
jgi:hypothetical protein